MTHQEVLAEIVAEIIALDAHCSILLRGSVATGEERPDSDIDLFVSFSEEPPNTSPLITSDNRNRMRVLKERRGGIKIDIGWNLIRDLPDHIPDTHHGGFYHAMKEGRILRDPSGALAADHEMRRRWLEAHPWVVEEWERQLVEMKRHKKDRSYPLKYQEQEFYAHLRELAAIHSQSTRQPTSPGDVAIRAAPEK